MTHEGQQCLTIITIFSDIGLSRFMVRPIIIGLPLYKRMRIILD